MKYGKLVDNKVEYCNNKYIVIDGKVFINPSDKILQMANIYPVYELDSLGTDYVKDDKLYHYKYNDLEELKLQKIKEIDDYDKSDSINGFNLMGMTLWIPRETRVSLQNSTSILLKNGIETTTLWDGLNHFDVPCAVLIAMLDQLEIYALQCFNKTAEHKANIIQMTNATDIANYDYTVGYPEKITFNL